MNALRYPIRQVAYAVPDPAAAALRHAACHGSGPFYLAEHVPVSNYQHRGRPGEFDHSTAIGQWGDLMVEFFVQHNPGPSHVHELFAFGGAGGFHHVAIIPPDLDAAVGEFVQLGFEVAASFWVGGANGFDVAMVDTRPLNGHITEIYADCAPIRAAYDLVRDAAATNDDRMTIRPIGF
ncbi:MAG: VOC family protein [Pseudomonadota bacterium]